MTSLFGGLAINSVYEVWLLFNTLIGYPLLACKSQLTFCKGIFCFPLGP